MIRMLLTVVLFGGAALLLSRQAELPRAIPVALPAIEEAPVAAPRPEPAPEPVAVLPPTPEPVAEIPPPPPAESPRSKPTVVARPAKPVLTSALPEALAVLESPSAGLPRAAAPRQPVTELLPDGTSRAAGGPSEPQAPPLARRVPAAARAVPQADAPPSAVVAVPPAETAAAPRASRADTYLKNAARILAETEIPK